jgi:hypothetical protein
MSERTETIKALILSMPDFMKGLPWNETLLCEEFKTIYEQLHKGTNQPSPMADEEALARRADRFAIRRGVGGESLLAKQMKAKNH